MSLGFRKNKNVVYVLDIDPLEMSRIRSTNTRKVWCSQKQLKINAGLSLEQQHEGKELYTGPARMDIRFFFTDKLHPGEYHCSHPDLDVLIKFITDLGSKILYPNDCIFSEIRAQKFYDKEPRAEFIITELKK